ncbi:uncharacterized protein LOC121869425, partial [Homarus americanus]|uniref:uncharacterized protein LOC121869425 n=1 Tax=Homarus americanus TaxID=6706 RepID=UPI001C449BFF
MELLTTKIIALTLMGVLSLFFGLLPLRMRKFLAHGSRKRDRIVSCLLCFGGGVLLATVFTHMLPETRENFQAAFSQEVLTVGADYPLAELVTCAGFFLVYFVEEFVHKIFFRQDTRKSRKLTKLAAAIEEESNNSSHQPHNHHHHHHHHHHGSHNHHHHHAHHTNGHLIHKDVPSKLEEAPVDKQELTRCSVYSVTAPGDDASDLTPKCRWAETGVDNPVFAGDLDATTWNPAVKESIVSSTQLTPTTPQGAARGSTVVPEMVQISQTNHGGHGHSHLGITKLGSKGIASNLRSLLVILALSFHSVFEGLAVGLQVRQVDVWYLFGA